MRTCFVTIALLMILAGPTSAAPRTPAADATATAATTPICREREDAMAGDKEESWLDHFQIYERTASGAEYNISDGIQFIDALSEIVIRRTSSDPAAIDSVDTEWEWQESADLKAGGSDGPRATLAKRRQQQLDREGTSDGADQRCAQQINDGFDVDAIVFRPHDSTCPRFVAASGQYTDVFNLYAPKTVDGCRVTPAALTTQRAFAKGDEITIPSSTFRHGDRLELQLSGDRVRDLVVPDCEDDKAARKRGCTLEYSTVWGRLERRSFVVVDHRRIKPLEVVRGGRLVGVVATTDRVDIQHDLVVELEGRNDDPLAGMLRYTTAPANGDILIEAEAISGTTSRKVEVVFNGGSPTLVGLKPEETVVLSIKRRVRKEKADEYIEVARYRFASVARGLHYAPKGDYAARYGTSSAFIVRATDADNSYGFAQTLAYTFYWKARDPGFLDHIGIGFHVAVLVTDADNTDAGSDRSGSGAELGIGGQITFGDSVVHLGGGYIPGADQGYLLLGLDLPDLVKAVGATR